MHACARQASHHFLVLLWLSMAPAIVAYRRLWSVDGDSLPHHPLSCRQLKVTIFGLWRRPPSRFGWMQLLRSLQYYILEQGVALDA